jgi:cation diffusion facilitator CzcD-associated flavoprotein CzcO
VFNQPNVELVDLRATPIERITPAGIRTSDTERAFDMIVYATGFDAITGAFDRIEFRGAGSRLLKDEWADGPRTYLGIQPAGFPNLFTIVGPHNASTFCNMTRCVEQNVDWISELLVRMREQGQQRAEATREAADAWTAHVHQVASRYLFMQVDSWMNGVNANIHRARGRVAMVYAGGAPKYRDRCDKEAAAGYPGFAFR